MEKTYIFIAMFVPEPPGKSNSLVAVSTGLLQTMDRRRMKAVLAHEVAHIANGDMMAPFSSHPPIESRIAALEAAA